MQTVGLFKKCVPKSMTSVYKTERLRCTLIYLTFVSFDVKYKSDILKNRCQVNERLSKSWNNTNLKVIPIKNAKPLSNDEVYLRFETTWSQYFLRIRQSYLTCYHLHQPASYQLILPSLPHQTKANDTMSKVNLKGNRVNKRGHICTKSQTRSFSVEAGRALPSVVY